MKKGKHFIKLLFMAGILVTAVVACDPSDDPGGDPLDTGTVKDVEGNVYDIVKIGTQTWMQSDLKVTKFNDGTPIAHITESEAWGNATVPAYCWYDNEYPQPDGSYGALYNGYAADMGALCPTGWHVPSLSELEELVNYCGPMGVDAPRKLKEAGRSHWTDNPESVTNETGFTALPGGYRNNTRYATFQFRGGTGVWWTSTSDASKLKTMAIYYTNAPAAFGKFPKGYGHSVRCIMD